MTEVIDVYDVEIANRAGPVAFAFKDSNQTILIICPWCGKTIGSTINKKGPYLLKVHEAGPEFMHEHLLDSRACNKLVATCILKSRTNVPKRRLWNNWGIEIIGEPVQAKAEAEEEEEDPEPI